jgi:hypoxanthine phosphoribosyltransferase
VVVGIAFGGVIPASLLSVFLRKPLCTIRAVHYSNQGRLPAPVVLESPGVFLDVPTLLVDDIADTGQTLEEVYEHLTSFGVRGENVRCSTLHRKPTSTFMPDWCVDVVVDGWVQYPWEEVDGNELLFRSGV